MKLRIEPVVYKANQDSFVGELVFDDVINGKQYRTNIVISEMEIKGHSQSSRTLIDLVVSRVNSAFLTLEKGTQP